MKYSKFMFPCALLFAVLMTGSSCIPKPKTTSVGEPESISGVTKDKTKSTDLDTLTVAHKETVTERAPVVPEDGITAIEYDFFTDMTCSVLKRGLTLAELTEIKDDYSRNLAKSLWYAENGKEPEAGEDSAIVPYDPAAQNRLVDIQAYPNPSVAAAANKTAPYGRLDNATGFCVWAGENVVVFIDRVVGDMTAVLIDPKAGTNIQQMSLRRGVNSFKAVGEGLMYIVCWTDSANWKEMRTKIHIASGVWNGKYVLGANQPVEWGAMLSRAIFSHIDMVGHYTNIIMPVESLIAKVPPADVDGYIEAWDTIVYQEQVFAGLEKYNRMNPTRMSAIGGNYTYHMFASSPGDYSYTGYSPQGLREIMPLSTFRSRNNIWGPAHEIGHINQLRPALNWGRGGVAGNLSEVSNNIFSLYIQTTVFGIESRLIGQYEYNTAYRRFFVERKLHTDMANNVYSEAFNRLVPFWQLYLYFTVAKQYKGGNGPEEFYMDLMEALRTDTTYDRYRTADKAQVRYCMDRFAWHVSRVAETNMVKFFNDYGFDLSPATVTAIDNMGHPAPAFEMRYIDDKNVGLYIYPAASSVVAGTATVTGTAPNYSIRVSDSKNAVVYEVFDSTAATAHPIHIDRRTGFSMSSRAAKTSLVVKAVGADGTRTNATMR